MDSILFVILFGFLLFVESSASSPHIILIVADDLGKNNNKVETSLGFLLRMYVLHKNY